MGYKVGHEAVTFPSASRGMKSSHPHFTQNDQHTSLEWGEAGVGETTNTLRCEGLAESWARDLSMLMVGAGF